VKTRKRPIVGLKTYMAMKKITFRADADKLELARLIAESKGTTLEAEVSQWLEDFASGRWKLPKRNEKDGKAGRK
jgi:hypothetical protein